VWGTDGPDEFDCGGPIVYGFRQTGGITQTTDYRAAALSDMTQKLDVTTALTTRGAFLYLPGHIAVSRGDGSTIEARNPTAGVLIDTAQGRGWTLAGILPQIVLSTWAVSRRSQMRCARTSGRHSGASAVA
jgi:cell wall-associated NlpC family hydrolase